MSVSNDTVSRRINKVSQNVTGQDRIETKPSLFAIQFDKSADVSHCFQLLMVERYVFQRNFKKKSKSCEPLETITRAEKVLQTVNHFFERKWKRRRF